MPTQPLTAAPAPSTPDRPNTQSVFFKSTTDRFENVDFKNPTIRILKNNLKGKRVAPATTKNPNSTGPQSNMISNESTRVGTAAEGLVTCINKAPQWTKQMRANDYETFSGKRVAFDVTSPRFNSNQIFYGQSLKLEIPGPGKYSDDMMITG